MEFGFDGCADKIKGLVDFRVKLVLREAVRQFHLDRGMEGLAAVLGIGRDLLRIRCVEFEHGFGSFLFWANRASSAAWAAEDDACRILF